MLSWRVRVSAVRCVYGKDDTSPVEERARLPCTWNVFRGRLVSFARLDVMNYCTGGVQFGMKLFVARIE